MQAVEHLSIDRVLGVATRFLPEIILCFTVIVSILCLLFKFTRSWVFYVSILGIILHMLVIPAFMLRSPLIPSGLNVFENLEATIRLIISAATLITILISGTRERMEYYVLIMSVLIGAELLAMNTHFIMILLSMEVISISSYVLTAGTESNKQRAEAAWKFFLFGSVATAIMIFGMTYIYGATGSLLLPNAPTSPLLTIGGVMMLGGFLFKMTAAPFHLWAPDVYEATPAPVVALLSVVPKLAGFVVIVSWCRFANADWSIVLAGVGIVTIIVGTLIALSQSNAKRMMAYSSVAQAGFFLMMIAGGAGFSTMIYYSLVFAIMNYIVFIVIDRVSDTSFVSFSGIGYANPLAAVCVTLGLVALVGLPPTAGFMAKLLVFSAIWTKYQDSGQLIFLLLLTIGILATAASLYFYLKIPFYAFFRRSEDQTFIKISPFTNLLLIILVGLLLALFLAPGLVDGLS
jgi:NADH-quinone oxidoreductase subunit N